jgi:hydrogenase-4 component B
MAWFFFLAMNAGYGAGVLGALFNSRRAVRGLFAAGGMVGAAGGLFLAIDVMVDGEFAFTLPGLLLPGGGAAFRVDTLGAFFLGVTSFVAFPIMLYGIGYSREESPRQARWVGSMLNLFLQIMSLVPLADNILTFLLLWESMSVTSYFLVIAESDHPETVRAGNWYIGMTQLGLSFLLGAFLLIGASDGSFSALRAAGPELSPTVRGAVFLLAAIGFGSKAGLVPLHVWLPLAHPAAPSHVSALMSGVMIKMGVYGILRVGLDLLGGGPPWWGGLLLVTGAASALLGVLYALMEHDLKRLLAYHSVENIGIIFIGLGAGFMFQSYGLDTLATLALVGGLFHTVNHACFKALLFLAAGAVVHVTGSRNMEEMGGLVKRMPRTALLFLVGAAAISALPPLNGFASEWIVFQALLGGVAIPREEVAILMPIAVAILALASGLAAACFVKAFGITFLGIPRSREAEHAGEVPCSMQAAMWILGLACTVLGVGAFAVVPALGRLVGEFVGLAATAPGLTLRLPLRVPGAVGQISPALLGVGLVALLALVPLTLRLAGAGRALRVSDTWGCGRIVQTPRMQYTATAFAEPLRRVFAEIYRPSEDVTIDFHPGSRYFVQSIQYRTTLLPWFERYLYLPVLAWVRLWAARARAIQSGSVHAYLAYIVGALVASLVLLLATGP